MGYAFISYSSKNGEIKKEFESLLKKNNLEFWLAPDDIPVGSKYAQVINTAIKNCSCFVLLLTKESINSQWVAKEVERAINYKKFIIPIQLDNVLLNDEFELYISTDQILTVKTFSKPSNELENLISTIREQNATSNFIKSDIKPAKTSDKSKTLDFSDENKPDTLKNAEKFALGIFDSMFNPKRIRRRIIRMFIFILCVVILGAALAIVPGLFSSNSNKNSNNNTFEQNYSAVASAIENAQNQMNNNQETEKQPDPSVQNQIPEKYQSKIVALMGSDNLTLANSTIRINVGGFATPQAAQVWPEVIIYSQDTTVAIGEGPVVKGVAPGETFVIVAAPSGMTSAYYVIVE